MFIETLLQLPNFINNFVYPMGKLMILLFILYYNKTIFNFLKPAILGKDGVLDMREVVTVSLLLITFYMVFYTVKLSSNVFPDIAWITILGGLLTSVGIKTYKDVNKKE